MDYQNTENNIALAREIAAALSEPNIELIQRVIAYLGEDAAKDFLARTQQIEAAGGLTTTSGARRRTPGGVFFLTVKKSIPSRLRHAIFPHAPTNGATTGTPGAPVEPLPWAQVEPIFKKLLSSTKGEAIVKLTLIGRPKQIAKAQACIVCMMEGRGVPAGMPKGLPTPPANFKQNVSVFIAEKQWRKVESSLKENKDDELIIDGWPYFDPAKQVTVLLAQGVTTKFTQRGKKQAQAAAA